MAGYEKLREVLVKPYELQIFIKDVLRPVFGDHLKAYANPILFTELNQTEQNLIQSVKCYAELALHDTNSSMRCYEVILKPKVHIERNRVGIQYFVRKLLSTGEAALVNFIHSGDRSVWRLSFVARDSKITSEKIETYTTHAKRYTYLLGPAETCRTAALRFSEISSVPYVNLKDLRTAFSVEKLSDEFFDEYKYHYENFVINLTKSPFKRSVFKDDEKAIRDFCKKLLGRIVFLYFVQKKGWMGASDLNYIDGDKDFILNLFKTSKSGIHFYNKWLCKLFFDTLNNPRKDDIFELPDGKKVRVPFLNGGLFDRDDYDFSSITFPTNWFHDPENEEIPDDRGFLDFLNSYNFTIHEDSPDDHTVAVDPEMLSHIFENLLEDNKDKGAFYTPKEIVHYMCQECLTEYLSTHLSKDYTVYKTFGSDQIEIFGNEGRIGQLKMVEKLGDKALDRNDIDHIVKYKDISKLTSQQLIRMGELLDSVKICDPAIGSGAFPMGLLQEIFSIKEVIAFVTKAEWNPAIVKLNIIQNSIYGVDIEKGAVDIARLRFWLSLVVNEDKPKALPNLDYKIVVGDSLVSKFDNEVVDIDWDLKDIVSEAKPLVQKIKIGLKNIEAFQSKFFAEEDPDKKRKHAFEIRNLKIGLLIDQLTFDKYKYQAKNRQQTKLGFIEKTQKEIDEEIAIKIRIDSFKETINKLESLKKNSSTQLKFFDWKLDFSEIMNPAVSGDNNGFDIIIGNPPWVSMKGKHGIEENKRNNLEMLTMKYEGNSYMPNLFEFFIRLSLKLTNIKGVFSFIVPDRLGFNTAYTYLREILLKDYLLLNIVYKWKFERIIADTMTFVLKNEKLDNYKVGIRTRPDNPNLLIDKSEILSSELKEFRGYDSLIIQQTVGKIKLKSIPLNIFCKSTSGFGGKSDKITETKVKTKQIEVAKGKSISKYGEIVPFYFEFKDEYITGRTRDIDKLGKKEKILLRKTGSSIIATYDNTGIYPEQSLYFLYDFEINPKYILALLNSKLISWYYQNRLVTNEDSTPQLKNFDLDSIPIAYAINYESKIADLAIKVLSLRSKNQETIKFEDEIDLLVFKLYQLSFDEVLIIDDEFRHKMNKTSYNKLDYGFEYGYPNRINESKQNTKSNRKGKTSIIELPDLGFDLN